MSAITNQVFANHQQVFANQQSDLEGAISRYSPMLFRVALRRLRNVEDAEDAVQDALLSACKYIGQFEGRSSVLTWLTRVVINEAVILARRFGATDGHKFVNGVLDRAAHLWRPTEH